MIEEKIVDNSVQIDQVSNELDKVVYYSREHQIPILIMQGERILAEILPFDDEKMGLWGCMSEKTEIVGDLLEPWKPEDYFNIPS